MDYTMIRIDDDDVCDYCGKNIRARAKAWITREGGIYCCQGHMTKATERRTAWTIIPAY